MPGMGAAKMRRSFTLPLKPFSVNAMYFGRSNGKTAACRDFERLFCYELGKTGPSTALAELRAAFQPGKHCYRMRLLWYSPKNILLTKDGALSSRAFDVTNFEKLAVDLVFQPSYFVQGAPNLNIDDKHLMTLTSGKRCGSGGGFKIVVTLWIEDLKKYVY